MAGDPVPSPSPASPPPSEPESAPATPASSASPIARIAPFWGRAAPSLRFLASWALLDLLVNLRYPAQEPALWYFLPSVDVVLLFFYFAIFGWNNWQVPTALRALMVGLVCLIRFIRIGDGVQGRFFFQPFNLYSDLPLLPELVRFSLSTLPWWKLVLCFVIVVGGFAALVIATYRALACAERYLSNMKNVRVVGVVTAASFLFLSMFAHDPYFEDFYYGGFAASAVPRLKHEAKFLMNVYGYSAEKTRAIAEAEERLTRLPADLGKLHHANVYLILVESYGQAVFDQPLLEERSRSTFDAFEAQIEALGFSIASGMMDSPTYGGQSWLAQVTLATAVRTVDQLQYDLVSSQHPKTIARFFRDAGYRTVLAHPGTQRAWPKGEFYQFDQKYYAWNFGYQGPEYAWATMPDQFVLDFIYRNEVQGQKRPLFIEYALVTSHAPWSDQPVRIDDWSMIQNGAIYNRLETVRYPITWPDFADASEAYIRSIIYDFDVLRSYVAEFVRDDSLVILLGDHQPVREISGEEEHHGVPVHVMSRDPALVDPFLKRGYVKGMRPPLEEPHPPMEGFLVHLLEDYAAPQPGIAP